MSDEHEWIGKDDPRMERWPSLRATMDYEMCIRCGVVKRRDGLNKPCKGTMPRITLREQPEEAE